MYIKYNLNVYSCLPNVSEKKEKKCHEGVTLFLFGVNEKHKTVSRGCTLPIKQPCNSTHVFPPNPCRVTWRRGVQWFPFSAV